MEKIRLSGLWQSKGKDGETYYAGSLSPGVRLLLFKNGFKRRKEDPDLIIYIAPSKSEVAGESSPEPGVRAGPHPGEMPF